MAAPIPLRPDCNAPLLRKLARGSRDPDQIRRLLALAEKPMRTRHVGALPRLKSNCVSGLEMLTISDERLEFVQSVRILNASKEGPRNKAAVRLFFRNNERVFCEERADFFGVALQGMHR